MSTQITKAEDIAKGPPLRIGFNTSLDLLPDYFAWEGSTVPASLAGMLEVLRVADMA